MRSCGDSIDDSQMSGLKPIGSHMLKLILEYSKLAAALDTTRHHMSVNGVFIPQNHGTMFCFCLSCVGRVSHRHSPPCGNDYYREDSKVPMKFHHRPPACKFTTCEFHWDFLSKELLKQLLALLMPNVYPRAVRCHELTVFRF